VRVERFIADESQTGNAGQKSLKACDVSPVLPAWQKDETGQIAECVDERRNLCRQAAARRAVTGHVWPTRGHATQPDLPKRWVSLCSSHPTANYR
jgi:hypothetical protein